MTINLYMGDLPPNLDLGTVVAIDSETMGLKPHRDRLCLIQLSSGDGNAHLVKFEQQNYNAPNLVKLLENPDITKIFHYARFDVAVINKYLQAQIDSIYCTKIASKLVRTYTDKHGLKDLCKELLLLDLSKQQQSSDWGAANLTAEQRAYAASDVLYLHQLRQRLDEMLIRENRMEIANACFQFLPTRAALDLIAYGDIDIFSH